MNNLIETIRLEFYRRNDMELGEFAKKIGVSHNNITNIFAVRNAPKLKTFLKMLEVLNLEIQYKTDLDITEAKTKAYEQAKSKEQAILFLWRNIALQVFAGKSESEIQKELANRLGKRKQAIKQYWNGTNLPRLDSLIALFKAVNVEIYLIVKPTNLNWFMITKKLYLEKKYDDSIDFIKLIEKIHQNSFWEVFLACYKIGDRSWHGIVRSLLTAQKFVQLDGCGIKPPKITAIGRGDLAKYFKSTIKFDFDHQEESWVQSQRSIQVEYFSNSGKIYQFVFSFNENADSHSVELKFPSESALSHWESDFWNVFINI